MKRIALINDLSSFGKCSLTAAIPVISAMGLQAVPVPTAILSAQTGFDHFFYDDYTDRMDQITDHFRELSFSFDGIATGFIGSGKQAEKIQYFLDKLQTKDTILLVDPIMGDHGKCMKAYSDELLESIKDLVKRADVITPNLTELCLLAGVSYEQLNAHQKETDFIQRITEVAHRVRETAKGEQTVVITGIVRKDEYGCMVGNLAVSKEKEAYFENVYTNRSFSGTGDLFASVLIGSLVKGNDITAAVRLAMRFLQPAIEETTKAQADTRHGILFEKYLSVLMEH